MLLEGRQVLHDVRVLAEALVDWYRTGSTSGLDAYSRTCLRRVWRAEHFSWWMTNMLHVAPDASDFDRQRQLVGGRLDGDGSGMDLDRVRAYAEAGVDLISVGRLTHSARAVDISFKIQTI